MELSPSTFDPENPARYHRWLLDLATRTTSDDVQAVLNLGAGVVLHGSLEPAHLQEVLRFVDPTVLRTLTIEHEQLAADLDLLEELAETEPDSEDVRLLAAALLERLRAHLARDERTLYRPMARLRAVESDEGGPE